MYTLRSKRRKLNSSGLVPFLVVSYNSAYANIDTENIYHHSKITRTPVCYQVYDSDEKLYNVIVKDQRICHIIDTASDDDSLSVHMKFWLNETVVHSVCVYLCINPQKFTDHIQRDGLIKHEIYLCRLFSQARIAPYMYWSDYRANITLEDFENKFIAPENTGLFENCSQIDIPQTEWTFDLLTQKMVLKSSAAEKTHVSCNGTVIVNSDVHVIEMLMKQIKTSGQNMNLLVVPWDMRMYWSNAIGRHHLSYIHVYNNDHMKNLNHSQISQTNVILTTYEFLNSAPHIRWLENVYRRLIKDYEFDKHFILKHGRYIIMRMMSKILEQDANSIIPLQCIEWNRVIFDNIEVVQYRRTQAFPDFISKHIWALSTHPDWSKFHDYCAIIKCTPPMWTPDIKKSIMEQCFIILPNVTRTLDMVEVHVIPMTVKDRRYYDATLEHNNNVNGNESKYDLISVATYPRPKHFNLHCDTLDNVAKYLGSRYQISSQFKMLEFFCQTVEQLKNNVSSLMCPICYSTSSNILTFCGHTFCSACMCAYLRDAHLHSIMCPMCKYVLSSSDICEFETDHGTSNIYAAQYGSKIAAIMEFIGVATSQSKSIIILCNYDHVVTLFSSLLKKQNIRHAQITADSKFRADQNALNAFEFSQVHCLLLTIHAIDDYCRIARGDIVILTHKIDLMTLNRISKTVPSATSQYHSFVCENTVESPSP